MQIKRRLSDALIVLAPLFLISCYVSPQPVYQLSPQVDDAIWLSGKEYAADSTNGIITFVAFDKSDAPNLIFDVEITNESEDQILVSPADFGYLPYRDPANAIPSRKIPALNPELELLKIDKDLSGEKSGYATKAAIDFTVSLLDLIAAIASPEHALSYEERLAYDINRNEYAQLHDARVAELKMLRQEWESEALRKTTLNPGEQVRGRVYFPVTKHARQIQLLLPIGAHTANLIFRQVEHR